MKALLQIILLVLLSSSFTYGQVGFDNDSPDASAVLDLNATDKGLLIPRMTTLQREAIVAPANSLLVFDTSVNKYFYFINNEWVPLSQWSSSGSNEDVFLETGNVGIGTTTPDYTLDVNGSINASALLVNGTPFSVNGTIPVGGIILWSGSITAIPAGWALCNGSNGTPNLRDRFIVGAGAIYDVGITGGSQSRYLTVGNLPSHSHTGTTSSGGSHFHGINGELMQKDGTSTKTVAALDTGSDVNHGTYLKYTNSSGTHSHSFTTSSTGYGSSVDIRPPYYALAYIMKLPD